jgi:hypothetical protein
MQDSMKIKVTLSHGAAGSRAQLSLAWKISVV